MPPPPELSWRTRRETRLISTFGLPTLFKACLSNSLFKLSVGFPLRARYVTGFPAAGNTKVGRL